MNVVKWIVEKIIQWEKIQWRQEDNETGSGDRRRGFLGKALVKKLLEQNIGVTSFSRHQYPSLTQMGVPQIQGDLTDANAVRHAVKGMDTVFHLAARPGVWGPYESYYAVNVTGTEMWWQPADLSG